MNDEYIHPPANARDLSPRQLAVARLVALHYTDQQIAHALGIKPSTVRVHIVAISYSIHANRARTIRTQIAEWWAKQTPDIRPAA